MKERLFIFLFIIPVALFGLVLIVVAGIPWYVLTRKDIIKSYLDLFEKFTEDIK